MDDMIPYGDSAGQLQQQQAQGYIPDNYGFSAVPQPAQPAQPQEAGSRTVLDAITGHTPPEGRRWNDFVERYGTYLSGIPAQNLQTMVNAENAMPQRQQGNTYGQELRAREYKRKTMMNQWDKLLWEWNHGYYSGNDDTVKDFFAVADNLRNAMVQEGVNPALIRPPSINAGGFAQGWQKAFSDTRKDMDWLGGWTKAIADNVSANPQWLNSTDAQMYFDKLSEYTILKWAQSKGAIADAEKVRAQVEAMPAQDRTYYDRFMSTFFNANAMDAIKALSDQGYTHATRLVDEMGALMDDSMRNPSTIVTRDEDGIITGIKHGKNIMKAAALLQNDLQREGVELPVDVASAISAHKNGVEAFNEYIMRNANVDRQMVWDSACDQMGILNDAYGRALPKLGLLRGWNYDGYIPDKSFGETLGAWQQQQPVNKVITTASLGMAPALPRKKEPPPVRQKPAQPAQSPSPAKPVHYKDKIVKTKEGKYTLDLSAL